MTTLPRSRPLTRDDLAAMPDDGHRYELIDGVLVETPAPSLPHQRVVTRLWRLLDDACPEGLEVLIAPFDVALAVDTVLQPDVLVARVADLTLRDLPAAPVLAVEVLPPAPAASTSPSSGRGTRRLAACRTGRSTRSSRR